MPFVPFAIEIGLLVMRVWNWIYVYCQLSPPFGPIRVNNTAFG